MRYAVRLAPSARRALTHGLPERIAAACAEFIHGPLAESPKQVGKQLREPLFPLYSARRGEFRVIYDIVDAEVVVEVVRVVHRRDAYRT